MSARTGPVISLVIATYDRPAELHRCLESLEAQTYPRECWEVVVVIDGSTRQTDEVLATWAERLPLRQIRQAHGGCGSARNAGAWHARGRYLVFTDDDCELPGECLSQYAEAFAREPDAVIAGRPINAVPENLYSQATQEVLDHVLAHFNPAGKEATVALGGNFGVPAEAFRVTGGFSASYFGVAGGEDRDFAWRWRAEGRRIVYIHDLVVRHAHVLTLTTFLRQHFNYGRGARLFHHARRHMPAPSLEAPGFYVSLIAHPWRTHSRGRAFHLSVLLLLSQAAHTVGYGVGTGASGRKTRTTSAHLGERPLSIADAPPRDSLP